MYKREINTSGIDAIVVGLLFVALLVLRATNIITWPWIWIFAPLWIPLALAFVVVSVILLLTALQGVIQRHRKHD
jgi:hypothetical protein